MGKVRSDIRVLLFSLLSVIDPPFVGALPTRGGGEGGDGADATEA